MKRLVEVIAKALVDHPEHVRVTEVKKENLVVYQLSVHANDMGIVIGKQGRVAKAIRQVVSATAASHDKRVTVDIV